MAVSLTVIALVAAYLLLVIGIGLRSYLRETKSGFLIGGRSLSLASNSATITASKVGTGFILSFISFVFLFGFQAFFFIFGGILGFYIFAQFAPYLREKSEEEEFYTLAHYFKSEFGSHIGLLTAVTSFLVMGLLFLLQLIGAGKVLSEILQLSYPLSLFLVAAPITVYIAVGGFNAVVDTDVIQNASLILLFLLLAGFFLTNVPILGEYSFQSMTPIRVLGFFVFGIFTPFGFPDLWQRIYAAESPEVAKRSMYVSMGLLVLIGTFIFAIGIQLTSMFPNIADPDLLLVQGLQSLSPIITGLGVVTLFAAIMSSADTYLFTSTAVFLQDFLYPEDVPLSVFRLTVVAIGAVGLGAGLFITSLPNATFLAAGYAGIITTVLGFAYVREHKEGMIAGFYTGLIGTTILASRGLSPSLMIKAIVLTAAGYLIGSLYGKIRD